MATHNLAATDTPENAGESVADDATPHTTLSTDKAWGDTMEFGSDPCSESGRYEVNDLRDVGANSEDDWMSRMLLSKEFQLLPAKNLQAIFARLEPIDYTAGSHIIEQDEVGEFFYIITRGRCLVTRKLPTGPGSLTLAELSVGDTFGEEALITDAPRQANITMVTDGAVMRLSKADFKELLSGPILEYVDSEEGDKIVADGGQWLDVSMRTPNQPEAPSATTRIPMYMLRLKLDVLDPASCYVVTSGNITHSCAAAHILSQYGFRVKVLQTNSD